jgi:hypothetical protein
LVRPSLFQAGQFEDQLSVLLTAIQEGNYNAALLSI